MTKWGLSHECKVGLTLENQCSSSYRQTKRENRETVSRNPEKSLNKIQQPSSIKAPSKIGIEENFLNLKKSIYGKYATDVILSGEGPDLSAPGQRGRRDVCSRRSPSALC